MAERFKGLLLRFRGRTRLTQRQLAERIGVSMRTVQGWETGVMYPSTMRLQALLTGLQQSGALTPGREAEEAQEMWTAVIEEAAHTHPPFDHRWFASVLDRQLSGSAAVAPQVQQDWGDAPTTLEFVGRSAELLTAREWVVQDHCRLIAVLGMGGIGKTSIAARLAHELAPAFERVYWRSVRNATPANEWMAGAIRFLSDQQLLLPDGESNQLQLLFELLRDRASLLVLDNFETLLEPAQRDRQYRNGYAEYGNLLRLAAQTSHKSCLVVTSREAPPEWSTLGGTAVRTLELGGLGVPEGQILLAPKQLSGDRAAWTKLVSQYGGNGLALKVVGESIRSVFGGDIAEFLESSSSESVFGGVRRLLAEQLDRSSELEQQVLRTLAVEREPVTIVQLFAILGSRVGRLAVLEAVEGLRTRSLVDRAEVSGEPAFTLQSVVLEYVTDQLVVDVCDEITLAQPRHLVEEPLIKAQAHEYVRASQERLIGQPVVHRLTAERGSGHVEKLLLSLLDYWRDRPRAEQGYGPGNTINLLRLLRGDLRGLDLGRLSLGQAYMQGIEAQDTRLVDADLSRAVVTEAFNFPLSTAVTADGTFVVAGTSAGEICLWRVADRTPLLAFQGHTGPIHGVALSGDGALLASASEDGTVRLWSMPDGRVLASLEGHTSPVYGVALSDDGRLVVSGGFDGTIRLWDVTSHASLGTLQGHDSPVWSVALNGDSTVVASGSFDGSIRLWDVATGQAIAALPSPASPIWSLRLANDGQLLASGSEDSIVRLWDVGTAQLRTELDGHSGSIRGVTLSADAGLVASASWDRTIRVWETAGGRPVTTLEGHTGPVRAVALSADGTTLVSASLDGSVRLWELAGGRPLAIFEGHTSPVYGVSLSGDARLLAAGSWSGSVTLWDVSGGTRIASLKGHTSPVYGVALSADGRVMASGSWDRTVCVWDASTGQLRTTLRGHSGGVRSIALSADGMLLATGSWDKTVRLWETPRWAPDRDAAGPRCWREKCRSQRGWARSGEWQS
jgi:WD40 repeat protein/transcriptional regulator with XRE-family HTH domain